MRAEQSRFQGTDSASAAVGRLRDLSARFFFNFSLCGIYTCNTDGDKPGSVNFNRRLKESQAGKAVSLHPDKVA